MKAGKKPTVKQCKFIQKHGLNAENWLVSKDTSTEMVLVHRLSDKTTIIIQKESRYDT